MFNTDLLWYLLVPLVLSVGTVVGLRRYCGWMTLGQLVGSCAVGWLISAGLLAGAFALGKGLQTSDTEILNGQVTGKTREHGHYLRSYECNCTTNTSCSGTGSSRSCSTTRTCQTCYEDRYTVKWDCQSTIGEFRIDSLDRSSRSVYDAPDPARYVGIAQGDPVARSQRYTNYIKAVPDSLFRPAQASLRERFATMIPAYPDQIHDIYRIRRVLGAGISVPNVRQWDAALSAMLKDLGPSHQVNAVLVFAKTPDRDYFHALQDAWVNGKKNDVVVVVGVDGFSQGPLWVNVMALTKNHLFQVKLVDRLEALETLTPETVLPALNDTIRSDFQRRPMADFQYLEAEIDPPGWLMVLMVLAIVAAYGAFWFHVLRHPRAGDYSAYGLPRMAARSRARDARPTARRSSPFVQ